jgi:hypothetical protein
MCSEAGVGRKGRIPYQQITDVFWDPDSPPWHNRLMWKEVDGRAYGFTMERAPTGLAAYVRQRVSDVERPVLAEGHVPLDEGGGGVTLSYELISDTDDHAVAHETGPRCSH